MLVKEIIYRIATDKLAEGRTEFIRLLYRPITFSISIALRSMFYS